MTGPEAEALLAECRRKIDAIDRQLRDLLNQRAEIVDGVVRAKETLGMPVHEPKREEEVLRRVTNDNPVIRSNETYDNHGNGIQVNGDCGSGGDGSITGAVIDVTGLLIYFLVGRGILGAL